MMRKTFVAALFLIFTTAASAQNVTKWKMADLVNYFSKKSDTVLVINFWATFCKPCVGEIPDFIKITNKYKKDKVKLLLVSLDLPFFYPNKIAAFAKKNNFNTNIGWLDETNADYFCPMIDKGWSGTIPATIIINANTGYTKFWEGDIQAAAFEKELKNAIADTKTSLLDPKFYMPMNDVVAINYFNKDKLGESGNPNAAVTFKSKDSTVFSVAGGEVTMIVKIDNIKVVIVKKDKLLYTYSNLSSTNLKKGNQIVANQRIGYAAAEIGGITPTVDFYLGNDVKNIYLTRENFETRKTGLMSIQGDGE